MKIILIILSLVGGNPTTIGGFSSIDACNQAAHDAKSFGDGHVFRCIEVK